MSEAQAWINVSIACKADEVALIEAKCTVAGALSIALADAGDQPLLEPAPGAVPLWDEVTLTALFAWSGTLPDELAILLPGQALRFTELAEEEWTSRWRQYVPEQIFGGRLTLLPFDATAPEDSTLAVLHLEPGLAFGTGGHPTTAMCLEWLATRDLTTRTVLDYGCGSGVLALAAARLGASRSVGVDHDPQACTATAENARRNHLQSTVEVYRPEACPTLTADVLVANILARPLIELAPRLALMLAPGAAVALAGLLVSDALAVIEAWSRWCPLQVGDERDGWVLLTGERSADGVADSRAGAGAP